MSSLSDFIRKAHHSFCSVVVVAAGNSVRMGRDKLFLPLEGVPVLARTLTALNNCNAVDEIIVVTQEEKLDVVGAMRSEYSLDKLKDTIKAASAGVVTETPDRSRLFAVQTPQAFDADIIKAALTKAVTDGRSYTDDCAAVEALGVKTYLSRGSEDNIKITTPPDLYLAEAIQRYRSGK